MFTNDSIDDDWKIWKDLVVGAVDLHVPKSKIRDIYSPPWIEGKVINLLHRKAKKTSSCVIWENFRKIRS